MIDIKRLEIAVIGDRDLVSGMRLAGVRRYRLIEEGAREEVRGALTEFINDPKVGIIIVLEDYMPDIEDLVAAARERGVSSPVIIEVPSKYGTHYGDVPQYYKAYIRRFIGFDIEI